MAALTRDAFEKRRAEPKRVARREGRWAALVAVGGGGIQLRFLRWADPHLERGLKSWISLPVFLVYLIAVGTRLRRLNRRVRSARLTCPHCGAMFGDLAESVAAATGRCDRCGGRVIEETE